MWIYKPKILDVFWEIVLQYKYFRTIKFNNLAAKAMWTHVILYIPYITLVVIFTWICKFYI